MEARSTNKQTNRKTTQFDTKPTSINPQALAALDSAIRAALTAGAFLQTLDPAERKRSARLGKRNEPFVARSITLGNQAPDLVVRQISLEELNTTKSNREALLALSGLLAQLKQGVDDTALLLGAKTYGDSLSIYETAKRFGRASGYAEAVNELRSLKRKPRIKTAAASPAAGGTPPPAPVAPKA